MNIAVCDGSDFFVNAFRQEIRKYDIAISFFGYSHFEDLMDACKMKHFDCIIINTEIDEKSGVDASLEIKLLSPDSEIIFVTENIHKYAQNIFYHSNVVRPFALFVKPVSRSFMHHIMDNFKLYLSEKGGVKLPIRNMDGDIINLSSADIIHIYHNNRISYIYAETGYYECRHKLSFFEERLPGSQFIHASKSTIINMEKVDNFSGSEINLTNGDTVYTSRNYKSAFKQGFTTYLEKGNESEKMSI